jgi:hypothetical protein
MPKAATTATQQRHSTTAQHHDGLSLPGWSSPRQPRKCSWRTALRRLRSGACEDSRPRAPKTAAERQCQLDSTRLQMRLESSTAHAQCVAEFLGPRRRHEECGLATLFFVATDFSFRIGLSEGRKRARNALGPHGARVRQPRLKADDRRQRPARERAEGLPFSGQETHTGPAACLEPHFALEQPLDRRKIAGWEPKRRERAT